MDDMYNKGVKTTSLEEFNAEAERVIRSLKPRESGATVVVLSGELGAGKTAFVQAAARVLGVEETVASPTFVILKTYPLEGQRFTKLVHIDAYRLKSAEELQKLGWADVAADAGTLVLLEWPERAEGLLPESAVRIRIDIDGDGRIITIDG